MCYPLDLKELHNEFEVVIYNVLAFGTSAIMHYLCRLSSGGVNMLLLELFASCNEKGPFCGITAWLTSRRQQPPPSHTRFVPLPRAR